MANSIITVPGLEIFTAEIEESCPIIEDTRSTQEGLKGRQGGKLKVAIPDPGKTFVKKVYAAVESGDKAAAQEALKAAEVELTKATSKGVYHKNTTSRKISRMTIMVNKMA